MSLATKSLIYNPWNHSKYKDGWWNVSTIKSAKSHYTSHTTFIFFSFAPNLFFELDSSKTNSLWSAPVGIFDCISVEYNFFLYYHNVPGVYFVVSTSISGNWISQGDQFFFNSRYQSEKIFNSGHVMLSYDVDDETFHRAYEQQNWNIFAMVKNVAETNA